MIVVDVVVGAGGGVLSMTYLGATGAAGEGEQPLPSALPLRKWTPVSPDTISLSKDSKKSKLSSYSR